ncbi:glycerol-3-phosphate acyltransferase, partial [Klebsiella quasipneumoniae]|uniref:glycerol-3-phosphate acyltransferase n=1 Tax=Klebsiella quasipneumoniae TaxID=1463165 RepID=UPI0035D4EA59
MQARQADCRWRPVWATRFRASPGLGMWPASYPIHIVVKTTKMTALTILMIILAYLGGSLSSAVLVSRITGLPDPRDHGSHNPGAT